MGNKNTEIPFSHHGALCTVPFVVQKDTISVVGAKDIFENLSQQLPSHLYNTEVIKRSLIESLKDWADRKDISCSKIYVDE